MLGRMRKPGKKNAKRLPRAPAKPLSKTCYSSGLIVQKLSSFECTNARFGCYYWNARCSKFSLHLDFAFVNIVPKLPTLFWDYNCVKKSAKVFRSLQPGQNCTCVRATIKVPVWDDCFSNVRSGGSTLECQALIASSENTLHGCRNLAQRKMLYLGCESFPRAFCKLHSSKQWRISCVVAVFFLSKLINRTTENALTVISITRVAITVFVSILAAIIPRSKIAKRKLKYQKTITFCENVKSTPHNCQITSFQKPSFVISRILFANNYETFARARDSFNFYQTEITINHCLALMNSFFLNFSSSYNSASGLIIFSMTRSQKNLDAIEGPVPAFRERFRDDPGFSVYTLQHYFNIGKNFEMDLNSHSYY